MSQTKNFGLIGYPVKHSLSPLMHNAALAHLKIKAKYKLFPLQEKDIGKFLRGLKKNNILGFNVTIPYKETIMRYAKGYVSEGVRAIGAANTIVVDKRGRLKAYNTDYIGFAKDVAAHKLKPKKVVLIGAGGAAKAIAFALGKLKVEEVAVFDIDRFRILTLIKRMGDIFPDIHWKAVANLDDVIFENKDLLINASPVGMQDTDPCVIDLRKLPTGIFVYDVIYNPQETKLLKLAKDKGLRYANGLGMLLYQGVEALNLWISPKKAPVELMRKVLSKGVKKL